MENNDIREAYRTVSKKMRGPLITGELKTFIDDKNGQRVVCGDKIEWKGDDITFTGIVRRITTRKNNQKVVWASTSKHCKCLDWSFEDESLFQLVECRKD